MTDNCGDMVGGPTYISLLVSYWLEAFSHGFFIFMQPHLETQWGMSSITVRGGHAQLFLSPQSQLRNLKESLPQSQFRNFLKNVAPQPQLRNSPIAICSEVRNFKSATWELYLRNFSADFWRRVAWNYIFLPPGVFCYWEDFNGTVAGDFCLLLTCKNYSTQGCEFETEIKKKRVPYGVDSEKNGGQKSCATVPLRQVFGIHTVKYCWLGVTF
jgi:hypothetical protein